MFFLLFIFKSVNIGSILHHREYFKLFR